MADRARQAKAAEPHSSPDSTRAAEPARAPISRAAFDSRRSVLLSSRGIQPSLRVSKPQDAAEKEADRVADAVMAMPGPAPVATQRGPPAIQREASAAGGPAAARPEVAAEVRSASGGGHPLPAKARGFLEPRFGASFAGVRVHTDAKAGKLANRLSAKAFTHGKDVFFGAGQFAPERKDGMHLLAHELTHTIQQGEAIQRKAVDGGTARVGQRTPRQASRLGLSDALDYFADAANAIPGYRMFTILLGVNPINMGAVEASAANILRAIVEFLPGGFVITQVLDSYGIFDKVGGWIEGQLKSLGISGASIKAAIDEFLGSLGWKDIFNLGGVWNRAKSIFTEPIGKIIAFAKSLFGEILRRVQEAVMRPLAALAQRVGGYNLLKAVMGKDPVTGEAFPRTPETVIGGFMEMIGQQELWGNIQRANAIPRAWAWFQTAMSGLVSLVSSIPDRFLSALKGLQIMDFVVLPSAFAKLASVFGTFLADFGSWALGTVIELAKIIVEVVAPGVMPYLQKAGAAFNTIVKNPVRFVQTLVAAAMQGFNQFKGNFLAHLKASLIGWVTGALGGTGVYIPQGFSLNEILKFVLSVLGLTWANVRSKLVAATSETTVKAFETGFDLVQKLVKEGPAAVWQQILESLSNLKEMVINQAMDFVKSKVVEAAVTKLLSMLSPAGALIQAIIAIWNTIMFFKERISQIAQVAASFIDSIATIAAGNIGPAANKVEQTMAGMLTLVISFLARIAGLGKVSDAILDLVKKIRAPINKGLDKAVGWVVGQAKKLGKLLVDKVTGKANRTPQDIERDKQKAQRELPGKIDGLLEGNPNKLKVRAKLAIWKLQYKLTDLKLAEAGGTGKFVATINPTFDLPGGVVCDVSDAELIVIVHDVCTTTLKQHPQMKQARAEAKANIDAQAAAGGAGKALLDASNARQKLALATLMAENAGNKTMPKDIVVRAGTDAQGNPIMVEWKRFGPQRDPNRFVQPLGSKGSAYRTKTGKDKREREGLLNALAKGPNAEAATVAGLQSLGTGQQLTAAAGDPKKLAELDILLHGQEVARHAENAAFSLMGRDLMEQKKMDLATLGTAHPAEPTGALKAQAAVRAAAKTGDVTTAPRDIKAAAEAKAVEQETRKKKPSAMAAARTREAGQRDAGRAEDVHKRSVALMTEWIKSEMAGGKPPVSKTKPKFLKWIRDSIRARLHKYISKGM